MSVAGQNFSYIYFYTVSRWGRTLNLSLASKWAFRSSLLGVQSFGCPMWCLLIRCFQTNQTRFPVWSKSICFLQTFWVKLQDLFWPRVMHFKPIFSGMSDILSSLREYSVHVRFWELSGCPEWVSSTGCVSRGSLGDFKGWHLHISFPFCKMGC